VPLQWPPNWRTSSVAAGSLALDASLARNTAGAPTTTPGALASLELFAVTNIRAYEQRLEVLGALGYGGRDVEGEARLDWLLGVRGYVTDSQGPFLRVGWVSHILANHSFATNYAAVAGEAGYQVITPSLGFEVGAQGGVTLRDSALMGGFATLAVSRHVLLRAQWQRFYETSGVVVDEVSTRGCVMVRPAVPVCLAFWSNTGPGGPAADGYAEISVGLGGIFTGMTRAKK
jgi:hypothetical protein